MLVIESDKCVVMAYSTDGHVIPHGPFNTNAEAYHYVSVLFNMQPAAMESILGYEIDHTRVTPCTTMIGLLRASDMVIKPVIKTTKKE